MAGQHHQQAAHLFNDLHVAKLSEYEGQARRQASSGHGQDGAHLWQQSGQPTRCLGGRQAREPALFMSLPGVREDLVTQGELNGLASRERGLKY